MVNLVLAISGFCFQRPRDGRRFSSGREAADGILRAARPARRLSFANSASSTFCRGTSFLVFGLAFVPGLAFLGAFARGACSSARAADEPAPAKYRAIRNCR